MNEELKVIITAEIAELKKQVDDAKKELEDLSKEGEKTGGKFGKAMGAVGKGVGVAVAAVAAAVGAMAGLAESTREYRTEQAKLNAAFQTAGGSAGLAKTTYNDLFRVLGDSGQATEAAQHLAKLTTNEQDLAEWTKICQGVYATFGDSLPIESLTEAINETAKTGEVTGALADALNWAGISEDEFADKLFLCNTEAERERLIRDTLNGKYATAAENYEETAGAIMDANLAQSALNDAMAAMGEAVEPIMTLLKSGLAGVLEELTPSIQMLSQGIQDLANGVDGAEETIKTAITNIVTTIVDTLADIVNEILAALPQILQTVIDIIVAVINGISENLPEIAQTIAEVIPQLVKVLFDNIPVILDAFVNLLGSIIDAIGIIIPILLDSLPELITSLIDSLVNSRGTLMEGGVKLFNGIIDAIIKIIPSILKNLPKIIDSIINGIAKAAPQLLQSTTTMFGGLIDGIKQVPSKIKSGLSNIVNTIKTQLVEKLKASLTFNWQLPKVKLPKFAVTPSGWKIGDLLKGVIPKLSVSWNALGGVFDKPTVFGYGNSLQGIGENGAEAVVPLENNLGWLDKLANMLSSRMGNGTPVVLQVDGKTLAKTTIGAINDLTRQQGKLSLNIV